MEYATLLISVLFFLSHFSTRVLVMLVRQAILP